MLQSLTLKHVKAFRELTLPLAPLTLLTGANGAGKSTVLQSLLLLHQSETQGHLDKGELLLNGGLVQIGMVEDLLHEGAPDTRIELALSSGDRRGMLSATASPPEARVLPLVGSHDLQTELVKLIRSLTWHYIGAERVGPRRYTQTAPVQPMGRSLMDPFGENALEFLYRHRSAQVLPERCLGAQGKRSFENKDPADSKLILQLERWLNHIVPGMRLDLREEPALDLLRIGYEFSNLFGWGRQYRATNVGFGLSYVLPVVLALLASKQDDLVLLENPEAHLHPGAQYELGALIAAAARSGTQVLIETHSDHILNAVRVQVRMELLKPEDVQIHFFHRDPEEGHAQVESPTLKSNGKLSSWPPGFFDQWDQALQALLAPKPRGPV